MNLLRRGLLRVFLFLAVAAALLFGIYDYQVSHEMAARLNDEQVQAGKRQLSQFSDEVRRTLERYQFKGLIDRSTDDFLQFDKLSQTLLNSSEYVSYVHWKNERGETLLFKGSDTLQKIIINEKGVTYLQSTTAEVREIHVARPGHIDRITDITSPILGNSLHAGTVSMGIDQQKIQARADEAARSLRHKTIAYSAAGLGLMGLTTLYVTWLMRRMDRMQNRMDRQGRLAYVGTLASGLVHEIRNPLNGISLNLSLLEDEVKDSGDKRLEASMERILGRIRPNLDQLGKIAEEFLMFARPPKPVLAPTCLDTVVTETMDFLKPECERHEVKVVMDLPESRPMPPAMLDREKLRQILLNLAKNSIQAMPKGGTLIVRTRADERWVYLDVEDTGTGIDPEARKKLFTLFYSTKERGVGLGLPIVKRLVEDHGGEIEVDSMPGVRTTIKIRFPLDPGPLASVAGGGLETGLVDDSSLEG